MSKKLLVALATVAALAGFGTLAGSAPAEAQGMYGPPHHFRQGPPPQFRHGPPPPHFRPPPPPPPVWHAPRHFAPRVYVAPAPFYAEDCQVIRKRVRVLTNHGWRWRLQDVRYCD